MPAAVGSATVALATVAPEAVGPTGIVGRLRLPWPDGGHATVLGGRFAKCPPGAFGLCLDAAAPRAAGADILLPVQDFGLPPLPALREALRVLLRQPHDRLLFIGCRAGLGRTGTVLACLARLCGAVPPGDVPAPPGDPPAPPGGRSAPAGDVVAWLRAHYHPRAIETAAQEDFARHAVLRA